MKGVKNEVWRLKRGNSQPSFYFSAFGEKGAKGLEPSTCSFALNCSNSNWATPPRRFGIWECGWGISRYLIFQSQILNPKSQIKMAPAGLEPATSRFEFLHSVPLSYEAKITATKLKWRLLFAFANLLGLNQLNGLFSRQLFFHVFISAFAESK